MEKKELLPIFKDGYTMWPNFIEAELMKVHLAPNEHTCLRAIINRTLGFNKVCDRIALSQFVEDTGLTVQSVCRSLRSICEDKGIIVKVKRGNASIYGIQADVSKWNIYRRELIDSDFKVSKRDVNDAIKEWGSTTEINDTERGEVNDTEREGLTEPLAEINDTERETLALPLDTRESFRESSIESSREKTYEISFEEFWEIAPSRNGKKIGREAAWKKFQKLKESDLANIIIAISNYRDSEMVQSGVGIKDPERFIANRDNPEFWKEWMVAEVRPEDDCSAPTQHGAGGKSGGRKKEPWEGCE